MDDLFFHRRHRYLASLGIEDTMLTMGRQK